ncbi:MAG: short-chain dehydrogenase/reductase [Ignavibacteria bacterium]|nr:short-chain dehydrogenase/reductase [Ignavibacteria bacterium]
MKILIFGACSAIARETAICFAEEGAKLFLVDLKESRLEAVRQDILTRHKTQIEIYECDANDFANHPAMLDAAIGALGGLDAVLIAHGTYPDQQALQLDIEAIRREFSTNCISIISLATLFAGYFEKQKSGCIAAISSVAGDRGRQRNYVYGSAKGAVSLFMQGLRGRLLPSGVKVVTIKPGQVDTPMTADMPKGFLFASAKVVGKGIYDAMKMGKDVVYLPGYWRWIMLIIKLIPESIFKKLKF